METTTEATLAAALHEALRAVVDDLHAQAADGTLPPSDRRQAGRELAALLDRVEPGDSGSGYRLLALAEYQEKRAQAQGDWKQLLPADEIAELEERAFGHFLANLSYEELVGITDYADQKKAET